MLLGHSMNKVIRDGAFAFIHKVDTVKDGQIAVVVINSKQVVLRKFSRQGELIILEAMSSDDPFNTEVYTKDSNIQIVGEYMGKIEINS